MILKKYLSKIEFSSYQEFLDNFKIKIPENFNFAYDVVDEIAASDPAKNCHGVV
jgi:acetyl-CoA synthetase